MEPEDSKRKTEPLAVKIEIDDELPTWNLTEDHPLHPHVSDREDISTESAANVGQASQIHTVSGSYNGLWVKQEIEEEEYDMTDDVSSRSKRRKFDPKIESSRPTRRSSRQQSLEVFVEEGSDIDDEFGDGDNGSDFDSGEEYLPSEDCLSDESDSGNVCNAVTENDTDSDMSEDEASDKELTTKWTRSLRNFPQVTPFTGSPGLKLPADFAAMPTPLDFYKLFITDDLIKKFQLETNRYAATVCKQKQSQADLSSRSIFLTWTPVTTEEMARFLAILIHIGLVKKTQLNDYWSTHPAISTTFASRLLKRSRFQSIHTFFHLTDNAHYIPRGRPDHDPLHKLRPLFDHLAERFRTLYTPGENICIDTAVCPWRGQSGVQCYMKDKSRKWGVKLYELCESSSGYVCNLEVKCRKPGVSNKPLDVCVRLLEPFANKGYTLFVDHFYCNPDFIEFLSTKNTAVVGTVKASRIGIPQNVAQKTLVQGEMVYRRKKQVLYVHWKGKHDVHMLTTKHLPDMTTVSSQTEEKRKPACLVDYISNMAGVNKSEQLMSHIPLHRKTMKFWKKLAFHLITLVMIQAHILCNKYKKQRNQHQLSLEDFAKSVCVSLGVVTESEQEAYSTGAANAPPNFINRLSPGLHFPQKIPGKPGAKRSTPSRGCKVCYAQSKYKGMSTKDLKSRVTRTSYQCEQCKVPLCILCFKVFHTVRNYQTL